jgi:hypothetical protein
MNRIEKGISSRSTNKGLHALHQESREAEQARLPAQPVGKGLKI